MKQKIFNALKQAYNALGLSEASLMGHAEMLAGLGIVTDDNLAEIVSKQATYLKGLQSENDKRVTTAVETAKKKFADEQEEARKKAEEEAAKKAAEEKEAQEKAEKEKAEKERIAKLEGFEKQFAEYKLEQEKIREAEKAEWEKRIDELLGKNKDTADTLANTRKQLEEKEKAEKAAERKAMINAKATKLGISKARIDEGFVIPDDMDEAGIDTYLTTVAGNLKTAGLPTGSNQKGVVLPDKVVKEDTDKIASSLLGF